MDVSSVHSPGSSLNGPPPMMSSIGANKPGRELERGSQCITDRQAEQRAAESRERCDH
jgi:hypothetical protein